MARAGVFIGVDKAGDLQKLNDAAAGARRMYEWALAQGMVKETHAKLLTDADGKKVRPDEIYDAIEAIIHGAGAEQLIVYFAGHGVNNNRNEYWLLSDAPVNGNAAVNVTGNVELARYCGVEHVVLISDACRTAAEGIKAQRVNGSDVFPNDGPGERAKPVDQFFACWLGKTAAELKDPAMAASNYSALYTNALLDALYGKDSGVLEPSAAGGTAFYVRPRKLEGYLELEIPRRVKAMNLQQKVNQNPDAIITSDPVQCWVSRIDEIPVIPSGGGETGSPTGGGGGGTSGPPLGGGSGTGGSGAYNEAGGFGAGGGVPGSVDSGAAVDLRENLSRGEVSAPLPISVPAATRNLIRAATNKDKFLMSSTLQKIKVAPVKGAEGLVDTVERVAAPFGPDHFETQCGIKVRGPRVLDFYAPRADAYLGNDRDVIRIDNLEKPGASVFLVFEGGFGTVVPALPGFIAALTFDGDELVDVSYEPSANHYRWESYRYDIDQMRLLRAVAASSSQHGRFRLDREDAEQIARKMQSVKGFDPTFGVYAAYAYHDLQEIGRIRDMAGYMRSDLGLTFFDVELLSRNLLDRQITPRDNIVPFFPLLSQGWALLDANRVRLHPLLDGIKTYMRDSLWVLFDPAGLNILRQVMQSKEVR
jgi:hypothetical protein